MINQSKNIYAFIDNQNLNVSVQSLGWKIDWAKFRKFLKNNYGVTRAFMFIGYMPEYEDMYKFLHEAGYSVVLKPTFDMTKTRSGNGEKDKNEEKRIIKGNIDTELVLWAVKDIKKYDKAVLVTGDGDFYSLVEFLEERGKLLKLLAPSWQYSSLFNKYDQYVERLDKHRRELEYKKRIFKKQPK
jgi:uncharacterized LabA/DUF88 family protein